MKITSSNSHWNISKYSITYYSGECLLKEKEKEKTNYINGKNLPKIKNIKNDYISMAFPWDECFDNIIYNMEDNKFAKY